MAEVDVGLPIPLPSGGYLDPRYASSSDLIDPRIIFGSPVQTGMNNAAEAQAMDPITQYLMMKAAEEASDRSGLTDTIKNSPPGKLARTVLGGLLDAIVPPAQAAETGQAADAGFAGQPVVAESPAMPPVQRGEPTLEQVRAMNYVPDSQIPMEGRRLPTNEQILIRQDWEGPGRGLAPGDTLPDGSMPVNMDGETLQTAQKLVNTGANSMQEVGVAATKDPTIMQSLKNFLGDEEKMLKLAMAFNTLRHRPDANLAQYATKRIETLGAQRQTNRTADALLARGIITPDQAEMIRMGLAKEVFGTDKFSRILEMMKTPEGMAQLQQLKEIGALGAPTVQIGGEQETELQKSLGKKLGEKVASDFDAGSQARTALDSLDVLMGLSETLDQSTVIPPALRGLVPEGVSDPIDAYRGVMTNVAKSLRIKGEGTMSDRDIDLLIRQAGPITSSLPARRIMQTALKRKAEINLKLSRLASDFMLNKIDRQTYLNSINELNNMSVLDDDMRKYISDLSAPQSGGQIKVISVTE